MMVSRPVATAGPASILVVGGPRTAIYGGLVSTALCAVLSHTLLSESDHEAAVARATGAKMCDLRPQSHLRPLSPGVRGEEECQCGL